MAVEAVPESPATTEWAATSEALQVPAQGATPAPQHAPEPAFAMAGAAMVGAAVGTVEAPTAYGQSPTGYGEAPTPYGQAPTGYGPPPAGYGPPAPASSPAAPAYMPEPSRYPAAPTAGLAGTRGRALVGHGCSRDAPRSARAPAPCRRRDAVAQRARPGHACRPVRNGRQRWARRGNRVRTDARGKRPLRGGHRPGTPTGSPRHATSPGSAVDQEAVPPSQAFSSQERESLSPQHIALLSWWADMMAAGQFPVPASAAGPDGTAPVRPPTGDEPGTSQSRLRP